MSEIFEYFFDKNTENTKYAEYNMKEEVAEEIPEQVFETVTSKVYVMTDDQSRIIRCEGGYTTPANLEGWTEIDEGTGDRYNLAQSHYFDDGLYTDDGIPKYKLVDGKPEQRTDEEINTQRLPVLKAIKVAQSKQDLQLYLASHPITWTDGKQYNITREKQQQLFFKLMTATLASKNSRPYTLVWNSTGEEYSNLTLEELTPLAFAIDSRVTALVSYQQEKEKIINNCATLDELNAVVVNYDCVE